MDLTRQVALVTGGGRGVGRAIALALAGAGAAVAVVARTAPQVAETAALAQAAGGRAIALTADVTDGAAVEQAVAAVERELGPVSLLVNGAGGGLGALGPIWEVEPALWWQEVELNLKGTFLPCRAVLPGMVARRAGRIISLGSSVGTRPTPFSSGYSCAKAALLRLTDSLAESVREYGIAVFAVSPGMVRTAQTELLLSTEAGRRWAPHAGQMRPEEWNSPEAANELVLQLASGRADGLSGRFFHVRDDLAEILRREADVRREDLYTLRLRKL